MIGTRKISFIYYLSGTKDGLTIEYQEGNGGLLELYTCVDGKLWQNIEAAHYSLLNFYQFYRF